MNRLMMKKESIKVIEQIFKGPFSQVLLKFKVSYILGLLLRLKFILIYIRLYYLGVSVLGIAAFVADLGITLIYTQESATCAT